MSTSMRYRTGLQAARVAGLIGTALLLDACASAAVEPTSALDAARAAIVNAEQSDASGYAAAELDAARQKMLRAEQAVEAGSAENMMLADRYAQQARVEAELAIARTESRKAAEINEDLTRSAEALQAEMRRAGGLQ